MPLVVLESPPAKRRRTVRRGPTEQQHDFTAHHRIYSKKRKTYQGRRNPVKVAQEEERRKAMEARVKAEAHARATCATQEDWERLHPNERDRRFAAADELFDAPESYAMRVFFQTDGTPLPPKMIRAKTAGNRQLAALEMRATPSGVQLPRAATVEAKQCAHCLEEYDGEHTPGSRECEENWAATLEAALDCSGKHRCNKCKRRYDDKRRHDEFWCPRSKSAHERVAPAIGFFTCYECAKPYTTWASHRCEPQPPLVMECKNRRCEMYGVEVDVCDHLCIFSSQAKT
jgi:hypothetical protein